MPPDDHEFVLETPATAIAAPVVRATAAAAAMAHDIPIEEITDIRLAVDEACSLLLPLAAPGTKLRCVVRVDGTAVDVTVQVTSATENSPTTESIDLQILRALTADLQARTEPDGPGTVRLVIRLLLNRTPT